VKIPCYYFMLCWRKFLNVVEYRFGIYGEIEKDFHVAKHMLCEQKMATFYIVVFYQDHDHDDDDDDAPARRRGKACNKLVK